MKFFCVKADQSTNNSRFIDMLKIVLQTPPELRTDDDHNKVFAYFNQDIYLNTFEKTRGVPKMMLAISVLEGLKITTPGQILEIIKNVQYLVVVEGRFSANNQIFKEKSCVFEKELSRMNDMSVEKDGCFIAYLTKENYQKLVQFQLDNIKCILESLKHFALFSQISNIHLLYLAANTVSETYRFRQFVYKFGQQSTYVYCIINGPFEMIRRFKKQKANYESSITSVGGGQTFGEDCVFLKCNRESEIRSLSCENFVYKMPSYCLVEVYNQYPKMRTELVETIKERRAYIEKRAAQIADCHTNPSNIKLKNASMHQGDSFLLPKLKQCILNRQKQKNETRITKHKTHQEIGMQLFAKAFNMNENSLLISLQKNQRNTKENILRTLGAGYLVSRLHKNRQQSKSIDSKIDDSMSKHQDEIKDSFIQLPLVESSNKPLRVEKLKNKYKRFKVKHRFQNQTGESTINHSMQDSFKKIFSLNY